MPYQTTRKTRVLLTGFGPFPGVPVNASAELARELAEAANRAFPGVEVVAAYLPTEWAEGRSELRGLLKRLAPDIALHFGVSERARGFEIEARGHNARAQCADARGANPPSIVVRDDGPLRRPANLPAHSIASRLRQAGIPALVSWDAGTYLCNALLYHALDRYNDDPTLRRNGFIHVPSGLMARYGRPPRTAPRCPLSWEQAVRGGVEIVAACLGRRPVRNAAKTCRLG